MERNNSELEKILLGNESSVIRYYIQEEMNKQNIDSNLNVAAVEKKKMIFTIVFSVLSFAIISCHFFHFRVPILWLEIVNIMIYMFFMLKLNSMSYLLKEVKSRPDEEIGYIVASVMSGAKNATKSLYIRSGVIVATAFLLILTFMKPHIMYESFEEDYYLRFYTKGIFQPKEIVIPENYKDGKVVGIRGNVFANLQGVESIELPDSIDTIRGYAFADSEDLMSVKMPKRLSYLGGGAFSGCRRLENIEIPEGLTEIRGNTFEGCQYLPKAVIPEGVKRIAAHAFCDCMFMEEVIFPSTLEEIGSSAFRRCDYLEKVEIPSKTKVDERAFKESETEIIYVD